MSLSLHSQQRRVEVARVRNNSESMDRSRVDLLSCIEAQGTTFRFECVYPAGVSFPETRAELSVYVRRSRIPNIDVALPLSNEEVNVDWLQAIASTYAVELMNASGKPPVRPWPPRYMGLRSRLYVVQKVNADPILRSYAASMRLLDERSLLYEGMQLVTERLGASGNEMIVIREDNEDNEALTAFMECTAEQLQRAAAETGVEAQLRDVRLL